MEARQTLAAGGSVPKALVVVIAACAALGLAGMAAAAINGFGASGAQAPSVGRPAAGTVLRQDNPVISQGASFVGAPVGTHSGRTSGNQFQDQGAAGGEDYGSSADLTRQLPVQGQTSDFEPAKGYRAQ
jgi:hypothetical protein